MLALLAAAVAGVCATVVPLLATGSVSLCEEVSPGLIDTPMFAQQGDERADALASRGAARLRLGRIDGAAADLDAALKYAAMIPGAQYGTVEVRPIMDFG